MKLSLWFVNPASPELFRFSLSGAGKATRFAERGKLASPASGAATFQWTSAVKAFSILTVGTRFARAAATKNTYELSGEKGSPAASLDFALSKPAAWAKDSFCHSAKHRADIRRVFRISNSEQKRAGPVTLSLTAAVDSIKVFVDGREILKREELDALVHALGGSTKTTQTELASSSEFIADFQNDAEQALQETELLEPLGVKKARARLRKLAWAKGNAQIKLALEQLQAAIPGAAQRYRRAEGAVPKSELKVRCPAMAIGVLILFRHVVRLFKAPIDIEYAFPSTSSMLEETTHRSASLVLSWGAISKTSALKRSHRAALLLPRTAIDILSDQDSPHSQVYLATEPRGYPMQYLNALRKSSRFRKLRAINSNFAEIHAALRQGQRSAVLSFPFSVFLGQRYGMEVFSPYNSASRIGDNVLLVDERDSESWDALIPFVREAWWNLLADRNLIATEIEALLSDQAYVRYLDRCAGIAAWAR